MNQREWLEWRSNGVGASDAAVLMGLFPFGKTPYMLWEEKINKTITKETEAMAHGKKYEDEALDWFEKKKGIALWRQLPEIDHEYEWMRATIDGLGDQGNCLVEAKVPFNVQNHYKTKQLGKVPDIYYPQCQQQMRVMGVNSMNFLSYNYQDPEDSIILSVFRDNEYVDNLIEKGLDFWNKVLKKEPPALTEHDYVNMDHSDEWKALALEWKLLQETTELNENRKEKIKARCRSLSKDKAARGHGIEMQRQDFKGYVDYSKIPELREVNLDLYRKERFTKWPIYIKKK